MKIENFKPFIGQHCETTTTGSLLYQIGIELSEPMLFGIGEGLGYIFWNSKMMGFPFIGGRVKPDVLTENICKNLGLRLEVEETSSTKKAWDNVVKNLEMGKPVGLKLDCFYLEYFSKQIHFAGHYSTIYGYDENLAYLNDTNQQGREAKTSLKSLELARNERGPMSSRNRSFTISREGETTNLKLAIKQAIYKNASEFLNPPIRNIGFKGILKTSSEIKKWFRTSTNIKKDFQTTAMIMEKAGTGGSLFRNLYRDFLEESAGLLNSNELSEASNEYASIASYWVRVSDLFYKVGETENSGFINEASEILAELSEMERRTMERLKSACS